MRRSSNPALKDSTFNKFMERASSTNTMTIEGTVNKTGFLLMIVALTAAWVWFHCQMTGSANVNPLNPEMTLPNIGLSQTYLIGGLVGGLISYFVIMFKPNTISMTAPVYAAFEGLLIGGISVYAETLYPGIAVQAGGLTMGVLFAMLSLYRTGVIKPTQKFKSCMMAALGGIFLLYMVNFVMHLFGSGIPFIHSSGPMGIGFSVFVVGIASLMLILDFDFIEQSSKNGAPKRMEWYGAFALLVTLVWLYIEILHLLMQLQSRD